MLQALTFKTFKTGSWCLSVFLPSFAKNWVKLMYQFPICWLFVCQSCESPSASSHQDRLHAYTTGKVPHKFIPLIFI